MRELAIYLRPILGIKDDSEPVDLCESGQRYAVYKVGPVLCVSHGVGSSTFSVVLHELLKLVKYAKCQDPVFIRIGTCGGVGVEPGTVVITKDAYNGYLKNEHEIVSVQVTEYLLTLNDFLFYFWRLARPFWESVWCDPPVSQTHSARRS